MFKKLLGSKLGSGGNTLDQDTIDEADYWVSEGGTIPEDLPRKLKSPC